MKTIDIEERKIELKFGLFNIVTPDYTCNKNSCLEMAIGAYDSAQYLFRGFLPWQK